MTKINNWVLHKLTEHHKEKWVDICINLLARHDNEPLLYFLVTCDEKWMVYDNRKRSAQWLDVGGNPQELSKTKIDVTKSFVVSVMNTTRFFPIKVLFSW